MERKYKAFISYRHLPLQMEVAKAVHRRIEHYTVPKNLRKDGARKVGLVFRDQDELPIAGSLSANIQTALDNSEFLIVICTPETSGSEWVLREISYFLEHHDHDHVLAVLADGAPEEAFPKQITEIRGEDGELLEIVEPLRSAADSFRRNPCAFWRLLSVAPMMRFTAASSATASAVLRSPRAPFSALPQPLLVCS